MLRVDVDLSVLDYCREDCGDPSLHPAHDGPRAGSVTVQRSTEEVFVGPVVAYRCEACGSETVAALGRRRPNCGYCRARHAQLRATGSAPGAAMCRGGAVDVARVRAADGARARRAAAKAPCPACGRVIEVMRSGLPRPHRPIEVDAVVDPVLTDAVLRAVGSRVPVAFADVYEAARDTYSAALSERSTQRAISLLVDARQVASIGGAVWTSARLRTNASSGWYIRYDSPKLWRPGGLRDLMSVVAQIEDDRAVTQASLGLHASRAARAEPRGATAFVS